MSGFQLGDSLEHGPRRRDVAEGEEVLHPALVDGARDAGIFEDALRLRAEDEGVPVPGVVERLDPEPVAYEPEPLLALIPERENAGASVRVAEIGVGKIEAPIDDADHHAASGSWFTAWPTIIRARVVV